MDKGLQSLYVAFGLLQWVESPDDRPCYAPLLLLPVELRNDDTSKPDTLHRIVEEDPIINPALAIKLEADFRITLPGVEDYEDLDVVEFLSDVAAAVSRQPGWEVQHRVVLGRFAFHKDVMYRDLLENQERIVNHPFVRSLVDDVAPVVDYAFDEPEDERLDEIAAPELMHSILDADSSQRKCIWAAAEGKTFVMDGPPGTGKSQTIANMIAELMAAGRSVLFVSLGPPTPKVADGPYSILGPASRMPVHHAWLPTQAAGVRSRSECEKRLRPGPGADLGTESQRVLQYVRGHPRVGSAHSRLLSR